MSEEHDAVVAFRYHLVRRLRERLNVSEAEAAQVADDVSLMFATMRGGFVITRREASRYRDAAVLRDFNGRNHAEVMRRYEISQTTLYRIIGNSRNTPKTEAPPG